MLIDSESQALEILDDSRREAVTREAAAHYLEHHSTKKLVPRLVLALQDEDEGVRWAAALARARVPPRL
jgi:HEAT repeat protein